MTRREVIKWFIEKALNDVKESEKKYIDIWFKDYTSLQIIIRDDTFDQPITERYTEVDISGSHGGNGIEHFEDFDINSSMSYYHNVSLYDLYNYIEMTEGVKEIKY